MLFFTYDGYLFGFTAAFENDFIESIGRTAT